MQDSINHNFDLESLMLNLGKNTGQKAIIFGNFDGEYSIIATQKCVGNGKIIYKFTCEILCKDGSLDNDAIYRMECTKSAFFKSCDSSSYHIFKDKTLEYIESILSPNCELSSTLYNKNRGFYQNIIALTPPQTTSIESILINRK